jgi:phage minor structural protein
VVVVDNIIRVYDSEMTKLAYLENAYGIGYELPLNELWTAHFSLPADDPKNIYCQPFHYVEIYDGKERVELFRIMPSTLTRNNQGDIAYQCEHVLATLLDDVLFKYHQVGNIGVGTVTVLRYILDRQLEKRWQLGTCDFDRRFEYKWENENLLAALFSVPQPFNEGYRWEFDTTGSTWRLNLKRLPAQFKADITYKKNMTEIQKEVDPTTIVTRLYCLGYGEGDNQLGIESVNGGIPYLESNGQTTTWGIKSSILVDRRFESPETLKAYGQALLDQLKHPYKSYTASAVDLYRKSPEKYEKFFPGDIVRIIDKEDGIIEDLPIVRISKSDITGSPGDVQIEIANKSRDIAGSISELADRTRINEVYAQGATNQMIVPFADNADPSNPAILRIYIPDTMARINKCILNYQLEPFRAYSKAVGGGGASVQSTSSGGGSAQSTGSGGGSSQSTSSGGGSYDSTGGGGGGYRTTDTDDSRNIWDLGGPYSIGDVMSLVDGHSHGIVPHRHPHSHSVNISSHSHTFNIPNHTHSVNIPNHTHSVNIPNHSHGINIPSHTHELQFGIYQGSTANSVTIKIDGKAIPVSSPGQDINIIPFLSVDSGGKVQRNTWHTVEIVPNRMTRVVANIFMQIFTNSRGGGDY